MINIKNVSKSFYLGDEEIKALDNITLNVTITPGAGTVTIKFNNKTYNLSESGVIDLGQYPAGDYNISVDFANNTGFTPIPSYVIPVHVQNWNFTELQNAINEAISNGTNNFTLQHDYVAEEGEGPINITSPITINGNEYVIDANNQKGIFNITGDIIYKTSAVQFQIFSFIPVTTNIKRKRRARRCTC